MPLRPVPELLRRQARQLHATANQMERLAERIESEGATRAKRNARLRERAEQARMTKAQTLEARIYRASQHPIIQMIALHFGVDIPTLCSKNRTQDIAFVRHVAAYLLTLSGMSTTKAGDLLNRDHSSIIHGVRLIRRRMVDPSFARTIMSITGQPPLPAAITNGSVGE